MPLLLVLLFAGTVLLEIVVILQVGAAIGVGWTVAALIATSVLGTWLLRLGGRRAWSTFRGALSEGRWPGDEVADGALMMAGGFLLVAPGFVTDAVGLLTLARPLRGVFTRRMRARYARSRDGDGRGSARGRRGGPPALGVEVVQIEREAGPADDTGAADTPPRDANEA